VQTVIPTASVIVRYLGPRKLSQLNEIFELPTLISACCDKFNPLPLGVLTLPCSILRERTGWSYSCDASFGTTPADCAKILSKGGGRVYSLCSFIQYKRFVVAYCPISQHLHPISSISSSSNPLKKSSGEAQHIPQKASFLSPF
jgi:hypothetical protein